MTFRRNLALSGAALLALTACMEVPENAIVVDQKGADRLASITDVAQAFPAVSDSAMVSAVGSNCVRYAGNLMGTRAAILQSGYTSIGKQRQGDTNIELFVADDGRPMMGIGQETGAKGAAMCMAMRPKGGNMSSALKAYMAKYQPTATFIGSMDTPSGKADNIYFTEGNPPVMYFTMTDTAPSIGRYDALAVASE